MYRTLILQINRNYSNRMSQKLFHKAYQQGVISRVKEMITGHENHLVDMKTFLEDKKIGSRHYQGCQPVSLDKINGSEGRCEDFDRSFHPRKAHNQERWLDIANAQEDGISLPPVELIQINDEFFVRDGHHRISVAKAFGNQDIEARVTVWEVS